MKLNRIFFFFTIIAVAWSCKNDDDSDMEVVPPRSLSEVAAENEAEIRAFLGSHFYNYEEFQTPPPNFDYKIKIDTIAGENADKTSILDDEKLKAIKLSVSPEELGLDQTNSVEHTYYYLEVREGAEEVSPTIADSVYIAYEGTLLSGSVFDERPYGWQYLPGLVRGYYNGVSNMKAGNNIKINDDGTTEIEGSGIGMIVIPSGLAYFSFPRSSLIPQYAPLIFKLNLGLHIQDTDFDNDGVPSILEDVNGDGILSNDNTDIDLELSAGVSLTSNHLDSDDDGDGVPTRDEISDDNGNIIIPYPDSNNDGTPDYLDPDVN